MKKQVVSILLILVLVFSFAVAGCATNDSIVITRASDYFNSYSVTKASPSTGVVHFTFSVTATNTATWLGITSYQIQERNDDGSYTTVYSNYTDRGLSSVISYSYGTDYSGTSGRYYRAKVTFYCSMNGGAESKTLTSSSIKAK